MKIIATHTYPSGNVLETAQNEDQFDISFYHNGPPADDYDRWAFTTKGQVDEIYSQMVNTDNMETFSNLCAAMGGK